MTLPTLLPNRRQSALPVGALVEWSSNTRDAHLAWAEIVYKEGRPPDALEADFDEALIKPEYSGVIAFPDADWTVHPDDQEALVDELLVLDFAPFGPLSDADHTWLERARTTGRSYIDTHGHVSIEASYTPAVDAEARDAKYFCRWMVENHADFLSRGHLGPAGIDAHDTDVLIEAMENSLAAIEDILARSGRFESWGGYWYLHETYEALCADFEIPGGPADLTQIRNHMTWVPDGRRTAYHGIGPIVEHYENARYEGYAKAVIMMNAMLAESVRASETADLRLDDAWLYGGTWRAEVQDGNVCPLASIDPTEPLGLGSMDEALDVHEPKTDEEDIEGEAPVEDGQPVFWSVALTRSMREEGRVLVHPKAALTPGEDNTVLLRIEHDGASAAERIQHLALSTDGRWLIAALFPLDFFDGIRLHCLARRGSHAMQASTLLLGGLDGGPRFDHDPAIVDPHRAPRNPPTLADLAVRIIDRHGEVLSDGWRHLPAERIARYLFGSEGTDDGAAVISSALEDAGSRVWHDPEGWWAHRRHGPARPPAPPEPEDDRGFFDGASEKLRARFEEAAERHRAGGRVVMHLRRLRNGEHLDPSYRARRMELYRKARAAAPNRDALDPELRPGYTFVIEHWRGGTRPGEEWAHE
jgi:hypothetical protein